jgi:hypothetical protein
LPVLVRATVRRDFFFAAAMGTPSVKRDAALAAGESGRSGR